MKELFRERALSRVNYYQSLLVGSGIATFIKNENVSVVEGVSIPEFFPALCVVNDDDYDSAVKLIQKDLSQSDKSDQSDAEDLICGICGESSPATFGSCWSCQAEFPESE